MVKENGMVMMTEFEYDQLIKKDKKLTRKEFITAFNSSIDYMFATNDTSNIYGKEVTVHWNGYYCSCSDGATPSNYIIPAIQDCDEELDEIDGK